MGTIYILQNKVNGKCYVGQTIRPFNKRFREHNRSNSLIGKALREYKVRSFNRITLEDIPDNQLDLLEQESIKKYNSISPNGYNSESGGHNGKKHLESSKQTMSEVHKGLPSGMKGKTQTEEARAKMSESKKGNTFWLGKTHSEESNEKNRIAHLGKTTWMKNKTHTEEARKLMSELKKGKPSSFKGKAHTEESKEKNRVAHLGVSPSNKGIRSPHPCPICGKQRKERYSKEGFKGYLKTCGSSVCITGLRNKSNSLKFLGSAKTSL